MNNLIFLTAYKMPDWNVISYLIAFVLPFIAFALTGAWLMGLFHYKKVAVNKGLGITSFVLAFIVPLIILLIAVLRA